MSRPSCHLQIILCIERTFRSGRSKDSRQHVLRTDRALPGVPRPDHHPRPMRRSSAGSPLQQATRAESATSCSRRKRSVSGLQPPNSSHATFSSPVLQQRYDSSRTTELTRASPRLQQDTAVVQATPRSQGDLLYLPRSYLQPTTRESLDEHPYKASRIPIPELRRPRWPPTHSDVRRSSTWRKWKSSTTCRWTSS